MKGKEKTILFFRSEYSNKKKEMTRSTNEFSRKKWSKFFFFSLLSFFFSFRREISSASWNVDKSVKVSLNLKSVSNQIR